MPLSDNGANQVLDAIANADTAGFPAGDPYIQLHDGDPGLAGTTNIVNVARVQAAFGAASGRTLSNSANVDFSSMPAQASPGVVGWSIWDIADPTPDDGSPLGACFWTGWFSTVAVTAQVDDEDLTNNDIESPTHGFVADDRVVFEALENFTVPTGITAGTLYFVIATGLADDIFRVSTTSGGAALDITAEGQCLVRKVLGKTTNLNDIFRIPAGDLDLFA